MPSSSSLHGTRHFLVLILNVLNKPHVLYLFFQCSSLFLCVYVPRSKEVDWQPYFTTRMVDDFATHLRVFRKAQDRLADREDKQSKHAHSYTLAFSLTVVTSMFGMSLTMIDDVALSLKEYFSPKMTICINQLLTSCYLEFVKKT